VAPRNGSVGLFEAHRDPRCMRGLQWVYIVPGGFDAKALCARFNAAFGEGLVLGRESWGPVQVLRAIKPFQFELRIGGRPAEFLLIHRVGAATTTRIENQERIEETLRAYCSAA
jgi:hypothetical protein